MNTMKLRFFHAVAGAAALLAVTVPVLADDDDGWFGRKGMMGQWFRGEMISRNMMDGWGPGMMMGSRFNEERLNALKTELAINDAQKKAWDDYAAAAKTAADSMRESHGQMMNSDAPATLPERIGLHDTMMASRCETVKSISAATLALYSALNNEQKKKADDLIMGMGMM
jgi:LTXXQ motif family protein